MNTLRLIRFETVSLGHNFPNRKLKRRRVDFRLRVLRHAFPAGESANGHHDQLVAGRQLHHRRLRRNGDMQTKPGLHRVNRRGMRRIQCRDHPSLNQPTHFLNRRHLAGDGHASVEHAVGDGKGEKYHLIHLPVNDGAKAPKQKNEKLGFVKELKRFNHQWKRGVSERLIRFIRGEV